LEGLVVWYKDPLTTTAGLTYVVLRSLTGNGTRMTSPNPPAPVLEIVGRQQATHIETRVRAQVDPGSDIMVLPESAAEAAGLQFAGDLETGGYDGVVTHWPLCVVMMTIADVALPPMSVVIIPHSLAILGRDVLNYLRNPLIHGADAATVLGVAFP
jgi:hypothetical protein